MNSARTHHRREPRQLFLVHADLHEVATGGLGATTIVEPLRQALGEGIDIRLGEIKRVHLTDNVVETSAGEIRYDVLLVALGAETNFYGIPDAAAHCFTLKSLRDAIDLKQRCIDAFEAAAVAATPALRRKLLGFAVVGGGPTGVELAAEMTEFVHGSLLPMYRSALEGARRASRSCSRQTTCFPSSRRRSAARRLRRSRRRKWTCG